MYGITFNLPIIECINGIPRATELPKQEERPRRALSSVLFCNKNFYNVDGKFERLKYEKFLLENNISAPLFEKSPHLYMLFQSL